MPNINGLGGIPRIDNATIMGVIDAFCEFAWTTCFRLIKETDTEIHVSTEDLEIPGVECIIVDIYKTTLPALSIDAQKDDKYRPKHKVTFEDGRVVQTYLSSALSTEYILVKCPISD